LSIETGWTILELSDMTPAQVYVYLASDSKLGGKRKIAKMPRSESALLLKKWERENRRKYGI
jgi:hypothetical protein